jgi:hypothetical protein
LLSLQWASSTLGLSLVAGRRGYPNHAETAVTRSKFADW